ncbi:MAG: FAD-dependent oxidoreductase [Gammaproteobacteria bacterium]
MNRKLIIGALVAAGSLAAIWLWSGNGPGLASMPQVLDDIRSRANEAPLAAGSSFFLVYVLTAALGIPGAVLLTTAAGAIFGTLQGLLLVSFASSIGATLNLLAARFLFRPLVERRFAASMERVNAGIRAEGLWYLFALRLVPVFPFFVINAVMGLTRLPARSFYWVSQIGMLPGTLVYVNAGTQLGQIETVSGIMSPALLASFALLGFFPLAARRCVALLRRRRLYAGFRRPERFDANVVVIGAGAAGLVSAYVAAAARAKVILIESGAMGGDCLNTGCVPSKALIRSARLAAYQRRASEFGLAASQGGADFPRVMQRVHEVIKRIQPHDSVERYTALGVECISGEARITTPWTVTVNGRELRTRSIIIATGGSPALPPVPGLEAIPHVTSDSLWALTELPRRLLVLGGGPIGCEMAQAFRRLGSEVTLVERLPRLLIREDEAVSAALAARFVEEGLVVLPDCEALRFEPHAGGGRLHCRHESRDLALDFDLALVATGRNARTAGLGLEALGIALNPNGTVAVNEYMQTSLPNILACGDVAGPWQLTHAAAHQAWYCAMNALWGRFWRFRADHSVMPAAVFTDPEVARVGLTEAEARAAGLDIEVTTHALDEHDRSIADGEARGFIRLITPRGSDRILGATIVAAHAGDIIGEFVLAMRHGLGLRKILSTVHIYPTLAEANKAAAGAWQSRHLPGRLLQLAAYLNRRQLGSSQP